MRRWPGPFFVSGSCHTESHHHCLLRSRKDGSHGWFVDEAPGRAQHVVGAQGYGVDRRRNADQRVDRRRLITLLDRQEFPSLGTGLWWALQTVTTVGYGDVTPATTAGRLVGAI